MGLSEDQEFTSMQSAPIDHTDQDVTAAVLTKAVVRAAGQLDLPTETLASVLGLSEDSISRMRHNGFRLEAGTKPFELGVLFVRFFRSLDAIVEGDEAVARSWLRNPNLAFDGRPLDKITTITGLTDAIAYLDARRASPN